VHKYVVEIEINSNQLVFYIGRETNSFVLIAERLRFIKQSIESSWFKVRIILQITIFKYSRQKYLNRGINFALIFFANILYTYIGYF
jgi:hypothetical protein